MMRMIEGTKTVPHEAMVGFTRSHLIKTQEEDAGGVRRTVALVTVGE